MGRPIEGVHTLPPSRVGVACLMPSAIEAALCCSAMTDGWGLTAVATTKLPFIATYVGCKQLVQYVHQWIGRPGFIALGLASLINRSGAQLLL